MARIVGWEISQMVLRHYFPYTTPIFDKEMGIRLKIARINLKLSQSELADKLGLNQVTISRLESGKLDLVPVSAEKFKTVLGKEFEYTLINSLSFAHEELTWEFDKKYKDWKAIRTVPKKVR